MLVRKGLLTSEEVLDEIKTVRREVEKTRETGIVVAMYVKKEISDVGSS